MNPISITSMEPTVFFVRNAADILLQRVHLTVACAEPLSNTVLIFQSPSTQSRIPLPPLQSGTNAFDIDVPDVREVASVTTILQCGDVALTERTFDWQPTKHWEVSLMHYSHHDVGYTDLPTDVFREHTAILDDVVRYCDATIDWPDDARFRFVAEQSWSIAHYIEHRPPEAVARLMAAIKRGQIEVTALFANEITELCSHEELIRLLYPAFELKRRYGIDIAMAEHNDIPGFSWGLANVLAGAGIRYFSPGIPRWYHHEVHQLWDEGLMLDMRQPGAVWWEAIDGARILLWFKSHGMDEWIPTSYENALRELPGKLAAFDHQAYAYDMVNFMLRGGWRDNAPSVPTYAGLVKQWNETWAYPHLINDTYGRFLSRFEHRWGSTLKTVRGEAPGTDYPVAAACTPQETAINRRAHDQLINAEKLATLAMQHTDYAYPKAVIDEGWRNTIFYDEHCWGMANPGGPAQDACASEKVAFAYRASALSHDVMLKAANRITDAIAYPQDAWYLSVFNPLSWERTDVVRASLRAWSPRSTPMHWHAVQDDPHGDLLQVSANAIGRNIAEPPESVLAQPFMLIDETTGQSVAYQISRATDPQAAQPWAAERVAMSKVDARYRLELVFIATAIPSIGYKTYRLAPCERWPEFAHGYTMSANNIDNPFYHLDIGNNGGINALIDKSLGQDIVDHAAPHGFGQILARSSEDAIEATIPATISRIDVAETGPLYTTLRLKGNVTGCPVITQEITLYHTLKQIDVNVRILRDSTPNLELYCAFPFHVDNPCFRYESAATVMKPLYDQLPGSNTDSYGVGHWAEVSTDKPDDYHNTVTWTSVDAPMAEFGGLWPGYVSGAHHGITPPGYGHPFLKEGELTRGHIYSLLMYNNFRTNFINVHAGETLFRYAFTSAPTAPSSQSFGWGVSDPPLAVWMKGAQAGALPVAQAFCQVDAPTASVMVLTWKPAEDGNGFILRLMETEGRETAVAITLPMMNIERASRCNLVEIDEETLLPHAKHTVQINLRPHAIATIRIVADTRVDLGL